MRLISVAIVLILLLCSSLSLASPYYGATFSTVLVGKEPPTLHGYQFMLNYDPVLKWRQFNLYFDGGFSHFWITNTSYYSVVNVYSAAPIIRLLFKKRGIATPYLDLSIGLSYLNHTRIDSRNLGIHFAFQDRIGIGILLGNTQQITLGIQAVHYSNAHLSKHNSGMTAPLVFSLGYRFQ